MPTFIFYCNRSKIDRIQGADIMGLEAKIQEHIGTGGSEEAGEDYGQGLVSSSGQINQSSNCIVINYIFIDGAKHIHIEAGVRVSE